MKKILFLGVLAGLLFSCNNKEDLIEEQVVNNNNTLALTVSTIPSGARAVNGQVADGTFSVIGSAKIYFIDGTGNKIYQRELTTTELAAIQNTSTTSSGSGTVKITGIPSSATTLYFVANVKTAAGTGYPDILGSVASDARIQVDKLQGGVNDIPMAGQSGTFTLVPNSTFEYTASVSITPLVSRLEILKVSCHQDNSQAPVNSDLVDFKVAGIYINKIYPAVLLSGEPYLTGAPVDIKSQPNWGLSSWTHYFDSSNTDFPYSTLGSPLAPSDWIDDALVDFCTPSTNAAGFYPDPTNGAIPASGQTSNLAWAYQLVPSNSSATQQAPDLPHIVVKLIDITYVNNTVAATTKYVTVTSYLLNGNPIYKFERGNIYRISDLTFSYNNVTDKPYEKNINVTASVTVIPWALNNIIPDLN